MVRPLAISSPAGMWRIFITSPSITISWISTTPATGDWPETRRTSCVASMCMNRPVAFCCGTVARTQGSVKVTCAWAAAARLRLARAKAMRFMSKIPVKKSE